MKILGLDSSGLTASAAIVEDDKLIAEYTINYKKTHSQTLLPMLDEIRKNIELDIQTVDAIAIASGPGSFTGLRIGAATAKGLGLALNRPLVEVPTLEGLTYNLWGSSGLICPIMDARRNQVYTGIYKTTRTLAGSPLEIVKTQCAVDIHSIIDTLNELQQEVIFLGDGVPVYMDTIIKHIKVSYNFAPPHRNLQSAASVAALGSRYYSMGKAIEASKHQPEYLRKSQAEREREEAAITIQKLQKRDIEAVSIIEEESFSIPWSAAAFEELLDAENKIYLVAKAGEEVIGCCGMTIVDGQGNIDNVVVTTSKRGQGIAQRMLIDLLEQGEKLGIQDYTLEVRVSNESAIHIYKKLGFVSVGIRPDFYEKPSEDADIMWKRHKVF